MEMLTGPCRSSIRPAREPKGSWGGHGRGSQAAVLLLLLALPGCHEEGPRPRPDSTDSRGETRREAAGTPAEKSIAIYVGRHLTEDGSVLLGGFGHEPSSHWLEITPAREFPEGTMLEVGVTSEARFPGERFRIPQVGRTARFVTSNYSEFAGFPAPLTNGGLNEHHVAARTVWSPSRQELRDMTPNPQKGLSYSDLARIVMERATTARDAARLVGELVESHGYATYGGNSFLFADPEEGWVVITYAGGQRLWAAERLGPDQVRVLYPGYIRAFPLSFREDPGYMGSPHLVQFAVDQGWFDPEGLEFMDLHEVYGRPFPSQPGEEDTLFRYPPDREKELMDLVPLTLADMMALVRDPRWSDDTAGYGQVAHLQKDRPRELAALWVALAAGVSTPMVPVYVASSDVPPEYKQHRYMTKEADATFLDPAFAPLEATRNAYRTFKRLFYYTCIRPETFLKSVTGELEAFESARMAEIPSVEREAIQRFRDGDREGAVAHLTGHVETWLLDALRLGEALVDAVERETRRQFSIPMPDRAVPEGATWRPESGSMAKPAEVDRLHCYQPGLDRYPRRHGSYRHLVGRLVQ